VGAVRGARYAVHRGFATQAIIFFARALCALRLCVFVSFPAASDAWRARKMNHFALFVVYTIAGEKWVKFPLRRTAGRAGVGAETCD
jgi:hypothetical protein